VELINIRSRTGRRAEESGFIADLDLPSGFLHAPGKQYRFIGNQIMTTRQMGVQHRMVYDRILARIRAGEYPPDTKLPSEQELVREFGVSRITITRAMHDLTRDGLIWRRQGSGTFVAQTVSVANRIAVIIPGLHTHEADSIFPHIIQHLVRQAARFDWQLLLGDPVLPEEPRTAGCGPVEVIRRLIANGIQGAIFVPYSLEGRGDALNHNVLTELERVKVPVVLLDRDITNLPGRSSWDLVCMDHMQAGYQIGRHLLARGCRRFAFVAGKPRFPTPLARLAGLRSALAENGLEIPDSMIFFGECDNPKLAQRILAKGRVDAVVCDNDYDAAIVMRDLLAAGAKIPAQLKLAGFDNAHIGKVLTIPLTTVAQPAESLAFKALSTLRDRIANRTLASCTLFLHGRLIARESSG
jgi:LacI family transcriptional regulator